jgi:protein TonB
MFEDTLLESSPRRASVLCRIHYLLSAFAGTLFFVQGLYLLPLLLAPAGARALLITATMVGGVAALSALMLCYVWSDTRQQRLGAWPWLGITLLLNLPGFLLYLVYSAQRTGDWKRAAIPLAYIAESILVGVLVLVPLIHTQALPRQFLLVDLHIPPPPGPPPATPAGQPVRPPDHHATVDPFTAPVTIPVGIKPVVDKPESAENPVGTERGVIGAPPGGSSGPSNWVINSLLADTAPPPPPPVVHAAPKPQIIRLPSVIVAAKLVYQPKPVYPQIAIVAHIQGTVVLQAIIGKEGAVQDLKVLSGHPLLVRAALDAVKTWRYQPTLLNSEPVEVLTEIDVIFRLGE